MTTVSERFWSKVTQASPEQCWLWTAAKARGYGHFRIEGKIVPAHRVAYELLIGPIPEGLELDHLCRVRHCVNPAHLEPVTHQENMRRGRFGSATHCPLKHPYDEKNTLFYDKPGGLVARQCRACNRKGKRDRNAQKRSLR